MATSLAWPSPLRGLLPLYECVQNKFTTVLTSPEQPLRTAESCRTDSGQENLWASREQNVCLLHHFHLPHSVPVALLWTDCRWLHLRPLPMSAERGGIRRFPVMAYSASQRSSPIHGCGMRWGRIEAQHSPWPEVKWKQRKGLIHAGLPWTMEPTWPSRELPATQGTLQSLFNFGPEKAWRRWGIRGAVRASTSALRPRQSWETQVDIQHRIDSPSWKGIYLNSIDFDLWIKKEKKADKDQPG